MDAFENPTVKCRGWESSSELGRTPLSPNYLKTQTALAWSSVEKEEHIRDLPSIPAPPDPPPNPTLSALSEPKTGFSDLNHDSA